MERRGLGRRALKKAPSERRLLKLAVVVVLTPVVLSVLVVLVLRFVDPPTTAFMERREAQAHAKGQAKYQTRHKWVPLSRISPELQLAVIAAEDQNFPKHFGFDVAAIEDAMEDRLEGRSRRGASTLTQQLAKNLFLWPGQSWVRKVLEAYFAVLLEVCWSKQRILEVYLNVAELSDGVYGVEMASQMAFGKSASRITSDEAALMAAVLPNPRARRITEPSPKVRERSEWIADQARRLGPATLRGLE